MRWPVRNENGVVNINSTGVLTALVRNIKVIVAGRVHRAVMPIFCTWTSSFCVSEAVGSMVTDKVEWL